MSEFDCTRCGQRHDPAFYMPIECKLRRIGLTATSDPAAFWALLPAEDVLVVAPRLVSAIPRVAGPWRLWMKQPEIWTRDASVGPWAASAYTAGPRTAPEFGWKLYALQTENPVGSIAEAKAAADAALVAAGWLLVGNDAEEARGR